MCPLATKSCSSEKWRIWNIKTRISSEIKMGTGRIRVKVVLISAPRLAFRMSHHNISKHSRHSINHYQARPLPWCEILLSPLTGVLYFVSPQPQQTSKQTDRVQLKCIIWCKRIRQGAGTRETARWLQHVTTIETISQQRIWYKLI